MKLRKKPIEPVRCEFSLDTYDKDMPPLTPDPASYTTVCDFIKAEIFAHNLDASDDEDGWLTPADPNWLEFNYGCITVRESNELWQEKLTKYSQDLADWEQWYSQNKDEIERIKAVREAKKLANKEKRKHKKSELNQVRQKVLAKLSPLERMALGI